MRMFVLFDKRAEQWLTPFFSKTNGTAYRELQEVVRSGGEGNMLSKYPNDFELYHVGEWNEHEGVLTSVPLQLIGTVDQVQG